MIFRISVAKQLAPFALAKVAQTSFAIPVLSLRSTGIPEMLKLHWLKSSFARNSPDSLSFDLEGNLYEATTTYLLCAVPDLSSRAA
jgi:hypothetical protein